MTPERLEIARRLRPLLDKYGWPMGMRLGVPDDADPSELNRAGRMGGGWGVREVEMFPTAVPDLDDPLTRLGLLEAVRHAHKDTSCGLVKAGNEWAVTVAYIALSDGDARMAVLRRGPTEESALVAALECAP